MLIQHKQLTDFITHILTAAGASAEMAFEVAEHLVVANLKGHDSHGVGLIPMYVYNIGRGLLDPKAHAKLTRDNGAVMLYDGGTGFGQVTGREVTEAAIERVKDTGVVCAGLRGTHHLARIGNYGELCGRAGLVSVHFVNVVGHDPFVVPWGGRDRRMSTNPFCCTVPREGQEPIVLDMATSMIAQGKVRVANMKGVPVPDGALVDSEGQPTSDPNVMFSEPAGSMSPFGKHKGYGLAFMCELLGGGLAGEWTVQPGNERAGHAINNMLMFVVDPVAFGNAERFQDEVLAMVDYIHSTEPARDVDRVRIPGEPEIESMAKREANGIPIDDNSWAGIVGAAEKVGLNQADIPH